MTHICDPWAAGGYPLPDDQPCPHDQTPPTAPPTTSTPPTTDCWHAVPPREGCTGPNPWATTTTTIIVVTPKQPGDTPTVPPTPPTTEPVVTDPPTSATTQAPTLVRTGPPRTHVAAQSHVATLPATGAYTGLEVLAAVLCVSFGTLIVKLTRRRDGTDTKERKRGQATEDRAGQERDDSRERSTAG